MIVVDIIRSSDRIYSTNNRSNSMATYILCLMTGLVNMTGGIISKDRVSISLGAFLVGFCCACIAIKSGWLDL